MFRQYLHANSFRGHDGKKAGAGGWLCRCRRLKSFLEGCGGHGAADPTL